MGEGIYLLPGTSLEIVFYIVILLCTVISSALIINTMGNILTAINQENENY